MRRILNGSFLLLALAGAGCLELPVSWQTQKPAEVDPVEFKRVERPVSADEINETNAREKAKALKMELDRDARKELEPDVDSGVKGKKTTKRS